MKVYQVGMAILAFCAVCLWLAMDAWSRESDCLDLIHVEKGTPYVFAERDPIVLYEEGVDPACQRYAKCLVDCENNTQDAACFVRCKRYLQ